MLSTAVITEYGKSIGVA